MDAKMGMTVVDFTFSINKAYERGYAKGRVDQQEDDARTRERRKAAYAARKSAGSVSFDEVLRDKELQGEFDRRVSKALATARAAWETSLQADAPIDPLPSWPIPGTEEAEEVEGHE